MPYPEAGLRVHLLEHVAVVLRVKRILDHAPEAHKREGSNELDALLVQRRNLLSISSLHWRIN